MTLDYIVKKYGLKINNSPVEIVNTGREILAKLFAELGFKTGAEIGVERGLYSEVLCRNNPGLKLFCVDPWKNYFEYDEFNRVMNQNYKETKKRLAPYNCELVRKLSVNAAKDIPDGSLDFVYIDGNHTLKYVIEDIQIWSRKVRKGGIIAGHDYRLVNPKIGQMNLTHHVVEAVDAYVRAYKVHPLFLFGRKDKLPGEIREKIRSWAFVKN